ncbi:MAG TPA: SAM-dependent chlorinase/fluorinase [Methylomirabilota bacterium]|nr:SAM-dependent chlorinase/fluorinase [Methylomirabilota bacterium]
MIVTLTSDFGDTDPFVGIVKGVILSINRQAQLVDLTHSIPKHDVLEAGLALEAAIPYFPPSSVHLAVVDPGVGSARRGLVVSARRHYFVAPDNGLLTFLFNGADWEAVKLENPAYRLLVVSSSFQGRDLFAPAAAHLSLGVPIHQFGPAVTDPVRLAWPAAARKGDSVVGEVIHVDHFGNLITNIQRELLTGLGENLVVEVAGVAVEGIASYFQDRPSGQPGAIVGSIERLEIFVSEGSAAAHFKAGKGTRVRVRGSGFGVRGS